MLFIAYTLQLKKVTTTVNPEERLTCPGSLCHETSIGHDGRKTVRQCRKNSTLKAMYQQS